MTTYSRRSTLIGAAILAVLFAVAVLMPSMAFASPGDSEGHAVPMSIGTTVTGTLVPLAGHPTKYVFENSVHLTVGQTIVATYTCAPAVTSPDMGLWGQFPTDIDWLGGDDFSPTVHVSWLLAPRTGPYIIAVGGSAAGTFTVETTVTAARTFSLSKLSAPTSAKKQKAFKVSVTLIGEFDQLNIPVRFVVEHKVRGKFKAFSTVKPKLANGGDAQHVPFYQNFKLSRGTYRIRARFVDAAHSTPIYNLGSWKTITVK